MKIKFVALIAFSLLLFVKSAYSQKIKFNNQAIEAINVFTTVETFSGKKVVKVIKDSAVKEFDEPTFARIKDVKFENGTIELKVLSRLLPNAPELARGFIGIAFRINDSNSKFESIYIRPTNGRAENQLRRNRSIQYFSYPDFKFDRLRREAPGEYEAYTDMALNQWIKLKLVVKGTKAQLFINDNKQPSLIVNDLKHGTSSTGAIGLWVDVGTEGYFADLKIIKEHK